RPGNRAQPQQNAAYADHSAGERLPDHGGSSSRPDPAIGEPSRQSCGSGANQVARAADPGHGGHGEMLFMDQLVGQRGEKEIVDVVAAQQTNTASPGGSQTQEFQEARRGGCECGWNDK